MNKDNVVGKIEFSDKITDVREPDKTYLTDGKLPKMVEQPQWFTTDKPLPDGYYGWRLDKGVDPLLFTVVDGVLCLDGYDVMWHIYYKGQFCKIEFPD